MKRYEKIRYEFLYINNMCYVFFFYFAEIRYRLIYLTISFLLTFFTCYIYSLELIYLFARPFLHSKHHLLMFDKGFIFTNFTEALNTTLKICFIWSSLFFLPFFFYQLWCFFTPSWYFFERTKVRFYIFSATLLAFLGGFCFYFLVLPLLIDFLLNFKINAPLFTIQLEARIDSYVRISSGVFLIVESLFQAPLLFSFLYYYSLIDSIFLSRNRKICLLFFLLLSAFIAPPEPLTQLFIFFFFWFFFEFIIWLGFLEYKKNLRQKKRKEKQSIIKYKISLD